MIEFQPPLRNCSIQRLTLPLMSPLNLSKVAVKLFWEGKTKGGTSTEQGLDQACIDVANTNLINANDGIIISYMGSSAQDGENEQYLS